LLGVLKGCSQVVFLPMKNRHVLVSFGETRTGVGILRIGGSQRAANIEGFAIVAECTVDVPLFLSGTPAINTADSYSITFTAINAAGTNVSQVFTLTVQ